MMILLLTLSVTYSNRYVEDEEDREQVNGKLILDSTVIPAKGSSNKISYMDRFYL